MPSCERARPNCNLFSARGLSYLSDLQSESIVFANPHGLLVRLVKPAFRQYRKRKYKTTDPFLVFPWANVT